MVYGERFLSAWFVPSHLDANRLRTTVWTKRCGATFPTAPPHPRTSYVIASANAGLPTW